MLYDYNVYLWDVCANTILVQQFAVHVHLSHHGIRIFYPRIRSFWPIVHLHDVLVHKWVIVENKKHTKLHEYFSASLSLTIPANWTCFHMRVCAFLFFYLFYIFLHCTFS